MRGGTARTPPKTATVSISIHPPRAGRDGILPVNISTTPNFNPPAPCGAGLLRSSASAEPTYFNPPAPCGAGRPPPGLNPWRGQFQSTRPVRGGTYSRGSDRRVRQDFNPPAPCGAGQLDTDAQGTDRDFNPPAPCEAGPHCGIWPGINRDFNPPAPCGAGPVCLPERLGLICNFNPPAPCGAGQLAICQRGPRIPFQSTRPVRGGTCAPLPFRPTRCNFNPPAPCGAGPVCQNPWSWAVRFQSTRPVRGGTITHHIERRC